MPTAVGAGARRIPAVRAAWRQSVATAWCSRALVVMEVASLVRRWASSPSSASPAGRRLDFGALALVDGGDGGERVGQLGGELGVRGTSEPDRRLHAA
ncbi:hypothetical protein [Nonomuraea dietziae]|uniref:hypothetical protein n=1 Tax=Nonomuraea dietziae TaxID=65515 RepID=UPI0031CDE976